MATSNISIINTLNLEQRRALLDYARDRADTHSSSLSDFRSLLRYRDRAYQRQLNTTAEHIKAVRSNMAGDSRKVQDITVPIVMPQVESAVAYQAGVFLTSYPIFGVVSAPQMQTQALQFESALGDQSIKYGWARELIKVFRDGFKYNFGAAVVSWKKTPLRAIVTDTSVTAAGLAAIRESSYGGNCIERIDPYNCFMDMSVAPANMHSEGEFFGYNKLISRVMLKRLMSMLDPAKTTNATAAYESQFAGSTTDSGYGRQYHTPEINQYLNLGATTTGGGTNWGSWMGLPGNQRSKIAYKDHYVLTHFYCRAVPQDFGAKGNQIKLYHCIIVNWKEVIFVEELNSGHDFLPAFVMQPYEDGLGYQTQSMLDNALPFQDMSSSLWNISLESKRRLIFDRLIYNPRYVDKKDIDPVSSVSRIPLRNANIGKEDNAMQRAVYQIPYREDNSASNLQMSEMISAMADQATGQNKVDRGQFQKGNKTKAEFDTTMQNSNSRQQLSALCIEQQFMTPVKETIKANTLQFQTAGSILNRDTRSVVEVDPVELRKAMLEFKMTDGMLPADKMLNSEVLTVFLQTGQAIPGIAAEYDIMGMFLYWAKLRGAYWLEDFKRSPEQQQQFMQNVQGIAAAQSTGDAAGDVQVAQAAGQAAGQAPV
jgi:hypothetical protein